MALPENAIRISDFITTNEVTPEDYVPIIRPDATDEMFDNYKTKARNFISYPYGYLWGGDFVYANGTCTIGHTHCRDSQGKANISIENSITKTVNASVFYPAGLPSTTRTCYVLVARKSETDTTATFFLSTSDGGALGSEWAYSRAVAQCVFNADTQSISDIICYHNEIAVVQKSDIAVGSALASGKLAIVYE